MTIFCVANQSVVFKATKNGFFMIGGESKWNG